MKRICGCDERVVLVSLRTTGLGGSRATQQARSTATKRCRQDPSISSHSHKHAPPDTYRRECAVTTTYLGDRRHKYAVTNDQVEKHEDAENRRMVKNEGEHALAAADEEAIDATKQEEWRASRESPAHVGVVASLRQRERDPLVTNKIRSEQGDWRLEMAITSLSYVAVRREHGMEGMKAVGVSSMIEDRPKIEVLSWRVTTFHRPAAPSERATLPPQNHASPP